MTVAAPVLDAAARAGRAGCPVAWLMIGLLLVQWAAQLCAAHCGMAAPVERHAESAAVVSAAAHGADAPLSPPAQASAGVDTPCLLVAWCDLGQVAMVSASPGADAEPPVSSGIAELPGGELRFLQAPEERPPTA